MLVVGKHISLTNYCDNFKKKRDCFYLEKKLRYLFRMVFTCLISWFSKTYKALSLECGIAPIESN